MKIQRRFTKPGVDPLDEVRWERRESVIREPDGTVVFEMRDIEVPADWSQVATDILAQKYFRKAGVPQPDGSLGRETSARQVVRRLAGCWTDWGRRYKYFDSDEDAATFDAELSYMLIHQLAAPNSPQWFNTGLAYAYGITGPAQGHYYVDPDTKELLRAKDSYSHPQPHACLPYHAPVTTPDGPIPIGEIVSKNLIGLDVYDERGTTKVRAVKHNGVKPVYLVKLANGNAIEATADHLVLSTCSHKGKTTWRRVDELKPGMRLIQRVDTKIQSGGSSMTIAETALGGWLQGDERAFASSLFEEAFAGVHRSVRAQNKAIGRTRVYGEQLREFVEKYELLAHSRAPALLRDEIIQSIECVGNFGVYDIETESHTFLTDNVVVHNCFIQSVEDDLVNESGIMDLWVREARLFKYGSGCVSERSFVNVSGRGLVRIGELYKELSAQRPVHQFDGKGKYVDISDLDLRTFSLDTKTGRILQDKIDRVWSYDVPKEDKLRVAFDTGARATVSAWHPFMVWNGNTIIEKRADQLKRGDAVLGPNSSVLRLIDEPANNVLQYRFPSYHSVASQAIDVDADLAWLVGYFLGDGSLGRCKHAIQRQGKAYEYQRLRLRFHDEDPEPLHKVSRILKDKFSAITSVNQDSRGSQGLTLTCTKTTACAFFAEVVHQPGSKGNSISMPAFVKLGSLDLKHAFLAGLIDSDGSAADGRAMLCTECESFAQEVAAFASLLGLGGGIVRNGTTYNVTIIRRSTPQRQTTKITRHLATPKHVVALEEYERPGRRAFCMPLDEVLSVKLFPDDDPEGRLLHKASGGLALHVGRLVYEGIINPHKILRAIAAKPEHEIDADLETLRLVAEGVAFVTDVSQCNEDVKFNDLTTRSTNTYLAGEHGLVVIHNTGTNFSNIRAEGEKLSGGGSSSGLMSFLRVGDRAAGAIKSGGTTRRAAKMVILDLDHPDIEKFINWKVEEEKKVAALIAAGYDSSYEGEAYTTVSGQNSNNSVRVPDKFIEAVRNDSTWDLLWRRDRSVARTLRARDVWDEIGRAAWSCADPGIQYDDIINSWHTCPEGGRIRASNPCVTADTLIATDNGAKPVAELIGRRFNALVDGKAYPSTREGFFFTGVKPVFELLTRERVSIKATANHKFLTIQNGVEAWKTLEQIETGDKLALHAHALLPVAALNTPDDPKIADGVAHRSTLTVDRVLPIGSAPVYDCTIPGPNAFDANGLYVHNCSEYMFLDDTACNLASLNLMKFYDADRNVFDVEGFKHASRLWTVVLEISVLMAQFPSESIARKSYEYRTLGLGYANLGTLLMVQGIPYDSPRALSIAGAITGMLTGESYATSAEMASDLGPFPRYKENSEHMLRVMRNHRRVTYNAPASEYEQLSVIPVGIDPSLCPPYLLSAARECWDRALELGEEFGYRNAQATCIAPTGTIALLMDCDTTGIEPDFALVKFKKLAGGGYFKIINQSIPVALRNLGYSEEQIDDIVRYVKGSGSLYGAPYINVETLRARGFSNEDIIKIEKALPTVFEIGFAFNQWTLGESTLQRLGVPAEDYTAKDFDLLQRLGFNRDEIAAANNYVCGTMTIEGAPHLKEEHYAVFDCANKCGKLGRRFIHHMGHVRMMAAAQPLVSGSISKTVNLPNEATVDEIKETYLRSWDLGLKAIAVYRDGSKLSQPLSNKGSDKDKLSDRQLALSEEFAKQLEEARKQRAEELRPDEILAAAQRILANATNTDFKRKVAQALERNRLPAKRRGWTQKAKIAGHTVFLRTGEYADGTLGEIFVDMHKEGASFRSLMNCFAIAVSIGLQYGVPLEEFVDKFVFTRFEPNGFVDHPNIKHCTSVVDYIFRVLGMEYLGRTDFVQVKPEDKDVDETHHEDHAQAEFEARVSAQQAADESTPKAQAQRAQPTTKPLPSNAANRSVAVDPELATQLSAIRSREAQMASLMGDAPMCDVCGAITRRNGTCYVCDSCGRSMGCS